ncbi:MAG: sigma-70 family RNA polymerase sigma factor [Verrucomicrobiota bacterium]
MASEETSTSDSQRTEAFIRLLSEHERNLSIYVTGMVGSIHDAQDILQEGKLVMWRHFDSFELGTNFLAWARKVLFYQVIAWRRKAKKRPLLGLDEETVELLDKTMENSMRERRWQDRDRLLTKCVESLPQKHRELIEARYRDKESIERLSHSFDKTEGAVYRLLSRVRRSLYDCVEAKMKI